MVCAWKRVPGYMCTISFRVHVCSSEHPDLSFTYQFVNLICGLGTLTTQFIVHFVSSQTSIFLLFWNDVHFYCVIYSVCVFFDAANILSVKECLFSVPQVDLIAT